MTPGTVSLYSRAESSLPAFSARFCSPKRSDFQLPNDPRDYRMAIAETALELAKQHPGRSTAKQNNDVRPVDVLQAIRVLTAPLKKELRRETALKNQVAKVDPGAAVEIAYELLGKRMATQQIVQDVQIAAQPLLEDLGYRPRSGPKRRR